MFDDTIHISNEFPNSKVISVSIPRKLIPVLLGGKEPIWFSKYGRNRFIVLKDNNISFGVFDVNIGEYTVSITRKKFEKLVKIFENMQKRPYGYTHDYICFRLHTDQDNKITYRDAKCRDKEL